MLSTATVDTSGCDLTESGSFSSDEELELDEEEEEEADVDVNEAGGEYLLLPPPLVATAIVALALGDRGVLASLDQERLVVAEADEMDVVDDACGDEAPALVSSVTLVTSGPVFSAGTGDDDDFFSFSSTRSSVLPAPPPPPLL